MTLDDIFEELDDFDVSASSISMGIIEFSSLKTKQITARLLDDLSNEISGFNKIPSKYLTDELIDKGTKLLLSKGSPSVFDGTPIEKYTKAAIQEISARNMHLISAHPELITKPMLLVAIENKVIGFDKPLLSNSFISKLIDDEVAMASINGRFDFAFKHPGGVNISDDLWVRAINDEPGVSKHLVNKNRDTLLQDLIKGGFWPEIFLGKKPADIAASVTKLMKTLPQNEYETQMVRLLILTHPIEDVLPLFKTPARKKLLASLYSIEDLKTQMKAFPYIKSIVLEESLGL
jgi:hypothetical protein